jgi:acyl carrier protein
MSELSSEGLWKNIVDVIVELLSERGEEPGTLSAETKVSHDLGLSSVDAIHLMIMLEDRLNTPLNFQELAVRDGEYVDDISLGELRAFLCRSVGLPAPS